jgi:tRNA A37 methylthiotransferase MiaB
MTGARHEVVVLAERDRETGWWCGLTANYVEVVFEGPEDLARRFAVVRITGADAERTAATLEEVLP